MDGETNKEQLGYFMGRVDNQLGQILDILGEQKGTLGEVVKGQQSQDLRLGSLSDRLDDLEEWKGQMKDPSDFIKWSTIREKITTPVIVGGIMFILTVLVPGLIVLLRK